MPRTASFVASLPRQGPPQGLIATPALPPRCHQSSLFLSNITLCGVAMATVGHQLEECNRETGGRKRNSQGLNRSWSQATSEVADALLPILWKGKLRNGPGLSLVPGKGGDNHALPRGLCPLAEEKLTEPFQQVSSARETSKQRRGGGLRHCAQEPRSLWAAAQRATHLLSSLPALRIFSTAQFLLKCK